MTSRQPPSSADLEHALAGLSAERRALLARLLAAERAQARSRVQIPALARDGGPLPVSYSQRRLWFLEELEPGELSYSESSCFRLSGELDVRVLERSIAEIVARHEVLRSVFDTRDGEPIARVLPAAPLELSPIDLCHLPGAEREAEALRRTELARRRGFDLRAGPLFRAELYRLGPARHLLAITLHHIVADGWSLGVFLAELGQLYDAFLDDAASPLSPLPIQYADYAGWQRERIESEELASQLQFWTERLAAHPGSLELPLDRPRPAKQTYRGDKVLLTVSEATSTKLYALASASGATPFMLLLAAFSTLLSRWSGQEDVIVGAPVAGRVRPELESLVGFFLNSVALRTRVDDDPTFSELLARVRDDALAAFAHQELPFERVLTAIRPARDSSRTPLFQVLLNMLDFPPVAAASSRLSIEVVPSREEVARFDLTLYARARRELELELVYNADLFEPETATALLGQLGTLLGAVVVDPRRPLSKLPLLADRVIAPRADRARVPPHPSFTRFEAGATLATIPARFSEIVRRFPERVAVRTPEASLTYAELDRAANRLARLLVTRLGRAPAQVGLVFGSDAEMVVGVLGTLEAGKAYVPLDPTFPAERLRVMARDAELSAIVTGREHLATARQLADVPCIALDESRSESSDDPALRGDPDALAYLLYTSGSTGTPKGVMQSHAGVLRHIRAYSNALGIGSGDVLSLLSTFGFDAAVMDIFGALLNGACLAVYPARARGLADLGAWLASSETTIFHSTPTLFRYFARDLERRDDVRHVRLVVLGGEEATADDLELLSTRFASGCWLVNGLGPTESTLALQHVAPPGTRASRRSVPVGYAVEGTEVLLLDRHGRATDVRGEIAIRSDAIARGYFRRAAETDAAFRPDPQGGTRRLYATGDLARRLPNGELEYLGRKDAQVKVRGHRIELGEIESALLALDGVKAAAVAVRADTSGEPALVAYLVPAPGADPPAFETLRERLAARLPEFMLPAVSMPLAELPLTPTGKLDRNALPAPSFGDSVAGEAPRTELERLVSTIFAETLRIDRVTRDSDFFAIGGHSLHATRVIARLRTALGVELPLRALFDASRVSELAARLEQLRPSARAATIERASRDCPLPLSFAQERLWFLDQLEPGSTAYNEPIVVAVRGKLDVSALDRALFELVSRHEALRTTFGSDAQGQGCQIVRALEHALLRVVEAPNREQIDAIVARETEQPFDLHTGPVIRALLVRIGPEEHVLCITVHHIAFDIWSAGIVVRDLVELYRGSELPPLDIQYADYAVWQRSQLHGALIEEQIEHWRRRLDGLETLALPTDHPRPALASGRGGVHRFEIDAETVASLDALALREGATLFMTLLGALSWLLGTYARQTDVAIGSPIAGRTQQETEQLIGFFVNTLVMRIDLAGVTTARELVARARAVALEAFAHQELPFEKLVDALSPARDLGRAPLFQVMLALQNAPEQALDISGLGFEVLPRPARAARFDLTLVFNQVDGRLSGRVEYASDLFDLATIEDLTARLAFLLKQIGREPDAPLGAPLLVDAREAARIRAFARGKTRERPKGATLHELFEAQARRTPDATALSSGREQVSYAELDRRSNRLARLLSRRGATRESVVAVLCERSPSMIVGWLAVLKAGAGFLPLDPGHPPERLELQISGCNARILLASTELARTLPRSVETVIDLDAPEALDESADALCTASFERQLAYVIYTSGSTGTPKGVCVEHSGVVNTVLDQGALFGIGEGARVLQFASPSFDASIWEVFGTLLSGATLELCHKDQLLPGPELARVLRDREISVVTLPPSSLAVLPDAELPGLETLIVAGEACSSELVRRWGGTRRFLNAYGPTEASICVSADRCTPRDERPTIGRPISNVSAYVLDPALQPVPVGAIGELFVGGAGVARGYAGQPELTAERFVPNPFGSGERLYRTGDLCRLRRDGRLEFFGRADHQVKLRGYRIELGEIEAELQRHSAVRDAVVVVSDQRLVAYVVLDAAGAQAALGEHLRTQLPAYMIPSAFIVLDAMPFTPNGKVDRRALATLRASPAAVAARRSGSELEQRLALLYAELLGLEQPSLDESFFALGGHSLLATRLVARISVELGVELGVRAVFETPSVAELARRIQPLLEADVEARPPIAVAPRDRPLPLSFAQERLWFLDQLEPGSAAYNVPIVLRVKGPLQLASLELALDRVVDRHESLRTTFATDPLGQGQQRVGPRVCSVLRVAEAQNPEELAALLVAEAEQPFDLSVGPVLRALLARVDHDEHLLAITIHHIAFDALSAPILVRELGELYRAAVERRGAELPALEIQYADYAVWQRARALDASMAAELEHWRLRLEGLQPLTLPTDRARPALPSGRGSAFRFEIDSGLVSALEQHARARDATLFMSVLGALSWLLAQYARRTDVAIGVPSAGRAQHQTEGLIGFFVNTLVMRVDLDGVETGAELLARARAVALDAFANQELPFEKLVDAIAPQRDLGRSPLFEVMLAMQDAPDEALAVSGLAFEPLPAPVTPARFDLTFFVSRAGGKLAGNITYASDLFEERTIAELADRFVRVLRQLADDPDAKLGSSLLLDAREADEIARLAAGPALPASGLRAFHAGFEAEARSDPERIALVSGQRRMTYGELDRLANGIAHRLHESGARAETRVALLVDRSFWLVAALLGTLKAGAAYVPLDPSHPDRRLTNAIEDSGARFVLTEQKHIGRIGSGAQAIALDAADVTPSATPPVVVIHDEQIAYVIYTSGSTGVPKGTSITQRGLASYLAWAAGAYDMRRGSKSVVLSSVAFDLTVTSLLLPLFVGGTVELPPEGDLLDELQSVADGKGGYDLVKLTPAHLSLLEELVGAERAAGFARTFVVGGEALHAERLGFWLDQGRARIVNEYGPTETVVGCAIHDVDPALERRGPVPIGRPIAGAELHVLDERLEPLPIGVWGELFIGGAGVARGYHARPELTAERFVPNPFSGAGERLYRTGDRCRWRRDGVLEFSGRFDDQIKLRGFRIELGEIEAGLRAHATVRDAAVVVREAESERRLVAYVVLDEPGAADRVMEHLRQTLPHYMLPGALVELDALPLTPNGKLDRKQLPAPSFEASGEHVAPRTANEETLARLFVEVLGVPRVGVNDDFFALGGDSILSIQVVSRARALGFSFSVRDLFEHPTVARLARLGRSKTELDVEPRPSGDVPLTPIQRWFFDRALEAPDHYNQAIVVRTMERLDEQALERALAALGEHHDALRLRFARDAQGSVIQSYADAPGVTIEHLDLSELEPSARSEALTRRSSELQASLDLERGPVLRVLHARFGPDAGSRIVFCAHHLVIDGVSWRILLEDLTRAYRDALRGESPLLPPKTASFKRWSEQLQAAASSPDTRAELAYWHEVLARVPPSESEHAEPPSATVDAALTLTARLGPGETRILLRDASRAFRARAQDLLLTAWAMAYARYSGSRRVALDLESHGRDEGLGIDVSRTLGWFTSIHPLVIDLPEDLDAAKVLRAVKYELQRVPRGGVGYGLLRHGAKPDAALAGRDGPRVAFNFFGQLDSALRDSPFSPAPESPGPSVDPRATRSHWLEVTAAVIDGALTIKLTCAPELDAGNAVQRLCDEMITALRVVLERSSSLEAHGYTPLDFPLAQLGWRELDGVVSHALQHSARGVELDPIEDVYPLSPLQEGLLFHALESPETALYTTPLAVRIDGRLDRVAFRKAWEIVMQRHAILRTCFAWRELERPLQVVHRHATLAWSEGSLVELSAAEQEQRVAELLAADRAAPFDLESPSLMRMRLLELGPTSHAFIWTHHHLLLDGWSTPKLVSEVLRIYEARERHERIDLAPAFRYRDYIAWLESRADNGGRELWTRLLAGLRTPTPVAPGGSMLRRRAQRSVEERQRRIDRRLTERLDAFARAERCTLATLLQAAWALLLGRYADVDDVAFGVTVAGRPPELPGIESGVGLFINAVPLRARVGRDKRVGELLAELRATMTSIRDFEHVALTTIRGFSEIPPSQPLFDSLIVFQNYPLDAALAETRAGLCLEPIGSFVQTNYAAVLVATPGSELSLRLRHDTSLFSADQAQVVLEQLEAVLAGMCANREQPLRNLSLETAAASAVLPDPALAIDEPRYEPITETIAGWAARTPDAVAVRHRGRSWSYAALALESRAIAQRLRAQGARKGDVVAIAGRQSFGMIAAILGALQAGAVFLTLDSKLPPARRELMLTQARAKLLLRIGTSDVDHPLSLDVDEQPETGQSDGGADFSPPSPEDPAYIFFTSGTTGVPRGVLGRHKGISHFLDWQRREFDIRPDDRCGQLTGLSFNVLLRSMFLPLTSGATLCLPDELEDLSGERVLPWLLAERIRVLHVVPTLTQSWLAQRPPELSLPDLRYAFFAGEPLLDTLVHDFREAFPSAEVVLLYGQTETTMAKCFSRLGNELPLGPQPIGRPLPSTQALVLDADRRRCAVSELGQVVIRTPYRTLGYLDAPSDTEARFVANPFRTQADDLLYLTGDRGYFLPDGTLQLVGRTDDQLKIWGVRVETAEVTATLLSHDGVREAHVAIGPPAHGDQPVLIAYVAAAEGVTARQLTAFLATRLPPAMLPAAYVFVGALPVNANGKVDRERLPAPEIAAKAEQIAPRTPMEQEVADIWQQLLGVERVGVEDDFFQLGGHSLLATRMASRIHAAFGVELPIRALFEMPTVAGVARAIAERQLEAMDDAEFAALLAEAEEGG